MELDKDSMINVNVPIRFRGTADCVGVKLGGVVRAVLRHMRVRCLPDKIPSHFEIDVRDLSLNHSKRLSSIDMPKDVKPITDLKEVAVIISKR